MGASVRVGVPTVAQAAPAAARGREDRAIARALRIPTQRVSEPGPPLGDIGTCGAFFRLRLGTEGREHLEVAFLDARHRLVLWSDCSRGRLTGQRSTRGW